MELSLTLIVAFIVTLISAPLSIFLAKRFNLLDDPKARPHPAHVQNRIIPRAGGIAIYLGIVLSAIFFVPVQKNLVGIFLGLTILLGIGIADDKLKSFNPYLRLVLIILAALMPVASGIGISYITNPLQAGSVIRLDQIVIPLNFLGEHKIIPIADLFALVWIVALTQIINWSKGVDGQMPGITLVASVVLGFLALKFYYQGDTGQLSIAKLSFITAGTSLGFLIFNWHPAKILPGFSGSTILAFMLATLSILSGAKVATALLVLGIPTADFIYTFFRRILSGKSPVWGDRGHLHHKLLALGWSHQRISLFYIIGSAMLGATALVFGTESKIFVSIVVGVSFLAFVLWVNSFGDLSKHPGRDSG